MSRHQRDKGRRGELEVQRRLNEIGGDAVLNYGQPELGGAQGDVQSTLGNYEVKRRASFPDWLEIADGVRGVYCRRDRGEWYVVVRANDWETLLERGGNAEKWRCVACGEYGHVATGPNICGREGGNGPA